MGFTIYLSKRTRCTNITKHPKIDGYQKSLASMVYNIFDKKTAVGAAKNEIMQKKKLAKELDKLIIRKFEKLKLHSSFVNNIWGLTVCYYHITYAFQSESVFCVCLNVKELLTRNRCEIWSLSDCNGNRTHNHSVHKLKDFMFESNCNIWDAEKKKDFYYVQLLFIANMHGLFL